MIEPMDIEEIRKATEARVTYPPAAITPDVLRFCKRLGNGNTTPVYLRVESFAGAVVNECVYNVKKAVAENGGAAVNGWTVWEWPTVMIESEFHSVWQTPEGRLVDVSPKQDGETRILFVPDDSIVWRQRRIPNKRMPLRKLPEISDFIAAAQRRHVLIGDTIGPYAMTKEIAQNEMRLAQAVAALIRRTPANLVTAARALSTETPPRLE